MTFMFRLIFKVPFKPEQTEKAPLSIFNIVSERCNDPLSVEQLENAYESMEMTDSGMIKLTMRFEHDRKTDLQITVKFLLMINDPLKPEQKENAKSPTNKTESGISNEPENPEQLENE